MVWWIAGAVVLLSLLVLAAVAAGLRRRLAELDRVAARARAGAGQAQELQTAAARLQTTMAGVQARMAGLQRRRGSG